MTDEAFSYLTQVFKHNGFSLYQVGGCVRDKLRGVPPHDYDLCTSALPEDMIKICNEHQWKYYTTGIKHGTLTIRFENAAFSPETIEITTMRIDGDYSDGRHPDTIKYTKKIEKDLARRDFTINAIARSVKDGLIDPYKGKIDIEKRRIKCVGNPNERFQEDGLRIMRALRFATRFNYSIESKTLSAMRKNINCLDNVSIERIKMELDYIFSTHRWNIFADIKYEFILSKIYHKIGVDDYSFDTVKSMFKRLTALSKPNPIIAYAVMTSFLRNDKIEQVLRNLKCSNKEINHIKKMRVIPNLNEDISIPTLRNYCIILGDYTLVLEWLNYLLVQGKITNNLYIRLQKDIKDIYNSDIPMSIADICVNGNDVKTLGFVDEYVGKILKSVFTEIIFERLPNNYDIVMDYIQLNFSNI